MGELSRVEDLLKTGAEEPKEPMSRLEAILRGEDIKPLSRIEKLIKEYSPSGGGTLVEKTITQNGIYLPADDEADGYSKVRVNVPSVEAQYLVYGYQPLWNDGSDAEAATTPLTLTTYNDYADYLEYIQPTSDTGGYPDGAGAFRVKKAFYGLITPWVINKQSSGGSPCGIINIIHGEPYSESSINKNTWEYLARSSSQGAIGYITDISNQNYGRIISIPYLLEADDYIYIRSTGGTGYPTQYVKIYKISDVDTDVINFMNSTKELSDTSSYSTVDLI